MIHTIKRDILAVERGYIVHGVNCRGAMGSGVAKAISDRYPKVKKEYLEYFETNDYIRLKPYEYLGECQYVEIVPDMLYVVNAFTQINYGRNSKVRYVSYDAISDVFANVIASRKLPKNKVDADFPICFPRIGAGLGGGDWNIIKLIIENELKKTNTHGYLFELE